MSGDDMRCVECWFNYEDDDLYDCPAVADGRVCEDCYEQLTGKSPLGHRG